MERKYSKTLQVHRTLITNCNGALIYAEFTKTDKDIELYREASVTDFDQ